MPLKIDNRHKIIGGRHRALARYHMLCNRVKNSHLPKNKNYQYVKVLVEKEAFISWFMPLDYVGCSVDRKDNMGHYELSNMQIIPLVVNIAKDHLQIKNGMRKCCVCKTEKILSDFVQDLRISVGVSTLCKSCEATRTNNYYHNHKKQSAYPTQSTG